jgi:selenocysteine lyase/cysteine desulfurase
MTHSDHKKLYSRFLKGHEGKLHFSAHSHHFWPDVSRDAHMEYWDDCAKASDEKWDKIFSEVIPKTQSHISNLLNLKDKNQIAFAPNTHELTSRLLSLFIGKPSLKILTTDSEFHSWRRQILRLSELPEVDVKMLSTKNLLTNRRELISCIKEELKQTPDIFFISQVFFDSGLALTDEELIELSESCSPSTLMVVDGYHGFAALPTNLSKLEGKIFYLGGGYKYAQAGEGVGFMVIPKGDWRPAYTGWFAEYTDLTKPTGAKVGYAKDAMAFMGATQDSSGFYRFNSSWDLFASEGLTPTVIHETIKKLQIYFLDHLPETFISSQHLTPLFDSKLQWHGHFLTFESKSEASAEQTQEGLKKLNILIDRRGKRLRFGFGLYQNTTDIQDLCQRLKNLAPTI